MKEKLLFLIVLVCCCEFLYAQDIYTIEIDFKDRTKIVVLPDGIKRGDWYKIEVKNLNPNLYSIVINSKDTLVSKALKIPTFSDIDISGLSNLGAASAIPAGVVADPDGVVTEINQFLGIIENDKKSFLNLTSKYESLKYEVYEKQIEQLSISGSGTAYDGIKGLKGFIDLRGKINVLIKDIKRHKDSYDKFLEAASTKKFLVKNPSYKDKLDGISSDFEKISLKSQELVEAVSADKILALIKTVLYLDNKSNKFVSLPIQFSEERATVTINFKPRDSTIAVQEEQMKFSFPLHSKQYWSVGTSFYYSNLKQSRYSVKSTSTNSLTTYQVIDQDQLDHEIGIAAVLRAGVRLHKDFGFHLNIGPGISIDEEVKPRLLFGAGFSYGKKHCITLDFGGIAGFVDRKANGFEVGVEMTDKPEELTVQKLQVAGFIALGYTFKL